VTDPAIVREKVCYTCRWLKPVKEFYRNRQSADGLDHYCKVCRRGKSSVSNPLRDHVFLLLSAARSRAKRQKVPFDLTEDDIAIPARCPVLGIPLERGEGKPTPNSPSLDKIIPALGYVKGNVAVISHRANSIKNNASIHELRALVRWLETYTE
jgi:hypothetical protein